MEDLRGQEFVFTDQESNTGFLVPSYWLPKIGENANSFFKSFAYIYSRDNSIMAVAKSLVDGALWTDTPPKPLYWMHQLTDNWATKERYRTGADLKNELLDSIKRLLN